jgi:multimeric flavodoxin WrbA
LIIFNCLRKLISVYIKIQNRSDNPDKNQADCIINDDMNIIYPLLNEADGYIFASPINMGHITAVMKTFLERICWVFAKPEKYPVQGCPVPRSDRNKKIVVITSTDIIKPVLRKFCDDATPLIKQTAHDSLNAKMTGSLYAGGVEKRSTVYYAQKAFNLGLKLAESLI